MTITIIGSGNVATQLGKAFRAAGHTISLVCSRTGSHAQKLARELNAGYTTSVKAVNACPTDVILIAVKDDAIPVVVKQLQPTRALVIHTSGATEISVLKKFPSRGVIWQVQTIKARRPVDFRKVPLVLEAGSAGARKKLVRLARDLSPLVHVYSSEQRRVLHLAASFSNNFVNHMYYRAKELMARHHLPWKLMEPLILSTTWNGIQDPRGAQTGPAKRNDRRSMKAHLRLIKNKELRQLYTVISRSIYQTYKHG